ncbi:iron ABC transporter ATP-binding protein, partial [Fischerella thermalis CCMEE 5330]
KKLNQQQYLTIVTVLHDVNLAARYSSRIALLSQGKIFALGTPEFVLEPTYLAEVLGVHVAVIETPVGLQICPLTSIHL